MPVHRVQTPCPHHGRPSQICSSPPAMRRRKKKTATPAKLNNIRPGTKQGSVPAPADERTQSKNRRITPGTPAGDQTKNKQAERRKAEQGKDDTGATDGNRPQARHPGQLTHQSGAGGARGGAGERYYEQTRRPAAYKKKALVNACLQTSAGRSNNSTTKSKKSRGEDAEARPRRELQGSVAEPGAA